ncbi:MAG TPA: cupin domain-containing protein [Candidatus Saccharimonadales bacterium]|nr:cupin domain-containing protein [Candidatus Saccharimonadales bacterium]
MNAVLPRLAEFCGELNGRIALPCFAHAYRSPANAQVFTPHWDSSSLLFVQMRGRTTWRVWDPVIPSTDELDKPRTISPTLQRRPPTLEVTLSEGDAMFVPASWPHGGYTTQGRGTLHVVIEVRHLNFGLTTLGVCC